MSIHFPASVDPACQNPNPRHSVHFPSSSRLVTYFPKEAVDDYFALKDQALSIKHPTLSPYLNHLIETPLASELKMAEIGIIQSYLEQGKTLPKSSFLDDYLNSSNDLKELMKVLVDDKGNISNARFIACKVIIEKSDMPNKTLLLHCLEHINLLEDIEIHECIKSLIEDSPRRALLTALFSLPNHRSDIQFLLGNSSNFLIRHLLHSLRLGILVVGEVQMPIAELKFNNLTDLLLYFINCHHANFGRIKNDFRQYNKDEFVELLIKNIEENCPTISDELFGNLYKKLIFNLWFEEKDGICSLFALIDGHYRPLKTFADVQEVISLFVLQSDQSPKAIEIQNYTTSNAFKSFLSSYCQIKTPNETQEDLHRKSIFKLPLNQRSGIHILANVIRATNEERPFITISPLNFLYRLNQFAHRFRKKLQDHPIVLFGELFYFSALETPIFLLPEEEFRAKIQKEFLFPTRGASSYEIKLSTQEVKHLLGKDIEGQIKQTPLEIASALSRDNEEFLENLHKIEHYVKHPKTILIGNSVALRMDLKTLTPFFCHISIGKIQPLDFKSLSSLNLVAGFHF